MSKDGISLSELARQLGITEGAVRKAIKSGRIPSEAVEHITVGKRTMPIITDPKLAARCYRAWTRHGKGHQAGSTANRSTPTQQANFTRAVFQAKAAQVDYEKKVGLLVAKSKVLVAVNVAATNLKAKLSKKHAALVDELEAEIRAAITDVGGPEGE